MFACSFCTSVSSPSWWQADVLPRWHLPEPAVLLIGIGFLLTLWAVQRLAGRRRVGVLLVAVAVGVGLPAAALTVNSARQYIEVATSSKPLDSPVWNVRCDSAFQERAMDHSRQTTTACSQATRPWRWAAIAMALASLLMVVAGVVLVITSRNDGPTRKSSESETPVGV